MGQGLGSRPCPACAWEIFGPVRQRWGAWGRCARAVCSVSQALFVPASASKHLLDSLLCRPVHPDQPRADAVGVALKDNGRALRLRPRRVCAQFQVL